ncbi:MAG TPA: class I lanthipeptide [Thermoanaerobaculia bacterium]|nr:class I lanthipeptide [Thermoanaerobaculia bacterium]
MKRNVKRLTLNRETLRYLNPQQMTDAAGGDVSGRICPVTDPCFVTYFNCPPPTTVSQQTCPTNCGQNYC